MASGEDVTALVDRLIGLFNARSMDLPDGWFTRHTQLLLNGVPFEEMLGRSPQDPLVLMIARGAAGYRFTAKAVQHAVPDAQLERGELRQTSDGLVRTVSGQCWLSGHYRGSGDAVDELLDVELRVRNGTIERASVAIDPSRLERLKQARQRD
jgi:hypothetical protein